MEVHARQRILITFTGTDLRLLARRRYCRAELGDAGSAGSCWAKVFSSWVCWKWLSIPGIAQGPKADGTPETFFLCFGIYILSYACDDPE